eukprot:2251016-Rhodomonas_salina.3
MGFRAEARDGQADQLASISAPSRVLFATASKSPKPKKNWPSCASRVGCTEVGGSNIFLQLWTQNLERIFHSAGG